jgi:hypothetical protein
LISVVLAGLPLYVMEFALGQFGSLGPTTVFRRMAPLFQGRIDILLFSVHDDKIMDSACFQDSAGAL